MRMHVRPAQRFDAPAMVAIYAPIVSDTAISFESRPPDAAAFRRRIEQVTASLPWLVAEVDGRVVAYAYASRHRERAAYRWAVETSVFVHADHRGRGIARALYAVLLSELEVLGYVTAWAGITLPNPASIKLHEALGFSPVGTYERVGYKHGAWRDVCWMRVPLAKPSDPPGEPLVWAPQRSRASSA